MDLALRAGSSALSGSQLPGWFAVSLVSHVLILAAGLAVAPAARAPFHPAALTVDLVPTPKTEHTTGLSAQSEAPQATAPQPAAPVPAVTPPEPSREIKHRASSHGPLPIENYFDVHEVDIRAQPINEVLLRYPWLEYKRRLGGVVSFRLYINTEGTLDKIELIEGTPPGHFEETALEAVRKLQFSPARRNGRLVKSQKTIDVVFDPDETLDRASARPPEPLAAGR